jgi:hypothetical protein
MAPNPSVQCDCCCFILRRGRRGFPSSNGPTYIAAPHPCSPSRSNRFRRIIKFYGVVDHEFICWVAQGKARIRKRQKYSRPNVARKVTAIHVSVMRQLLSEVGDGFCTGYNYRDSCKYISAVRLNLTAYPYLQLSRYTYRCPVEDGPKGPNNTTIGAPAPGILCWYRN